MRGPEYPLLSTHDQPLIRIIPCNQAQNNPHSNNLWVFPIPGLLTGSTTEPGYSGYSGLIWHTVNPQSVKRWTPQLYTLHERKRGGNGPLLGSLGGNFSLHKGFRLKGIHYEALPTIPRTFLVVESTWESYHLVSNCDKGWHTMIVNFKFHNHSWYARVISSPKWTFSFSLRDHRGSPTLFTMKFVLICLEHLVEIIVARVGFFMSILNSTSC